MEDRISVVRVSSDVFMHIGFVDADGVDDFRGK